MYQGFFRRLNRVSHSGLAGAVRAEQRFGLGVDVLTPGRQLFEVMVFFRRNGGTRVLLNGTQLGGDGEISAVRCSDARAVGHGRRVRLDIPATCLGTPPWVRVSASTAGREFGDDGGMRLLEDDALRDGRDSGTGARRSPRIPRG